MRKALLRALLLLLVSTQSSFAEKFRGYIWDKAEGAPPRRGRPGPCERLHQAPSEKTTRGSPLKTFALDGRSRLTVRSVKMRSSPKKSRSGENATTMSTSRAMSKSTKMAPSRSMASRSFGRKGRRPRSCVRGMHFKGKGIYLDDDTIQIKEAKLRSPGFDEDEAKFMGLVSEEVDKMKEGLPYLDDPELQAYVAEMGQRLVPSWVSPDQFNFTFSVIDDPSLNAFALPDGTVVIHTGLLAALENEAQFATVIGHEIAHATHLHGYRGYKQQSKMKWLQIGAAVGGIAVGAKTDSVLAGVLTGVGSSLALGAVVTQPVSGSTFRD